jgi:DNA-binding transcriptional MerR regulator
MVTYSSINRKLSISEMAQINDITRQTLIYYDKIDLFKPDITEPNGYRYYSTLQIPLLREICFLRSIGMPLDAIRKNNKYNNSTTTIELLDAQNAKLDAEIRKLAAQKQKIEERIQVYQQPNEYDGSELSSPRVQYFPERHLIYHAWNKSDLTRHGLHFALMKAWNESICCLPAATAP